MTTESPAPDLSAIKERQQKTWATGDYTRIGNPLVIMGELLCEAADVHAGERVLDVATGSCNTAISAACRFCETTGIDYVPELIEYARKHAEVEGMNITFEVGDAEALPYPDGSFDVVLSTVGVMFAPDQEKAASELPAVEVPVAALPVPYRTHSHEPTFQSLCDPCYATLPLGLPFPTALDPFYCNRYEISDFARQARNLGVGYLGLCCGAAPHYVRSMAEALGRTPPASRYSADMSRHAFLGTDPTLQEHNVEYRNRL